MNYAYQPWVTDHGSMGILMWPVVCLLALLLACLIRASVLEECVVCVCVHVEVEWLSGMHCIQCGYDL